MNHVHLMGRLVGDVDYRVSDSGKPSARYTLAVPKKFKREGEPDSNFLRCICFGSGADFANKYLHKGKLIAVEGSIETGSYDKNGAKVYTTDIWVRSHYFAGREEQKGSAPKETAKPSEYFEVDEVIKDDDLPF